MTLLEKYRADQKQMVISFRAGVYTQDEYRQKQLDCWETYLFDRYEEEPTEKNKNEVFDHVFEKSVDEYIEVRNNFILKKITEKEYQIAVQSIFTSNIQDLMSVGLGKELSLKEISYWIDKLDAKMAMVDTSNGFDKVPGVMCQALCAVQYPEIKQFRDDYVKYL